jgi:UDP-4-amino-4,6-dideoxy-N-acetyl-beta-L-altrosamine transaminase
MISYGKQSITDEDIEAVVSVLKSDFLTQGPKITEFEKIICDYTGAKYCIAVANGTAALHLAILSLNIPLGKRGITSTNTFTASATSMIYAGLEVDFADIDSTTYNITPDTIKERMTSDTRLVIPVHFAGQPCRMKEIRELAESKNCNVIEDAAHAIGSSYQDGDRVGSCRYSDLTTFSFHPVKTITTGEGGAITTNNKVIYDRLLLLRSHGITKTPESLSQNPGPWYYEMQQLGYNYRLSDIQAALGISQFNRLENFKKRRRDLVHSYNLAFNNLEWLSIPYEKDNVESCFHLYVVNIDFNKLGLSRKVVMERLLKDGIGTQVHYIPVHTQPFYQTKGTWNCPNADSYYEKALSLPLYPDMTEEIQKSVITSVINLNK